MTLNKCLEQGKETMTMEQAGDELPKVKIKKSKPFSIIVGVIVVILIVVAIVMCQKNKSYPKQFENIAEQVAEEYYSENISKFGNSSKNPQFAISYMQCLFGTFENIESIPDVEYVYQFYVESENGCYEICVSLNNNDVYINSKTQTVKLESDDISQLNVHVSERDETSFSEYKSTSKAQIDTLIKEDKSKYRYITDKNIWIVADK